MHFQHYLLHIINSLLPVINDPFIHLKGLKVLQLPGHLRRSLLLHSTILAALRVALVLVVGGGEIVFSLFLLVLHLSFEPSELQRLLIELFVQ